MFRKHDTKFVWTYASLLVVVLVVLTATVAVARKPASASVCEQAVQWAKENEEILPRNLDDFLAVPIEYRRAVFDALPPEIKGKLWITHLERYLISHDDLGADQISVIKEAVDIIGQSNIYVASNDSLQQDLVTLKERAITAFGEKEATLIFAQLGSDNQQQSLPAVGNCQCYTKDDWCWGGKICRNQLDCMKTEMGCGTFWLFPCDGLCRINPWP